MIFAAALAVASAFGASAFGAETAFAPADEMEADWLEQGGAVPTGMTHGAWRAKMLKRRAVRLASVAKFAKRWVYCRHWVMGGSHYAYTEALSDAQNERTYLAIGSRLCLAEYTPDGLWRETTLLESKEGCFRDVDVSPDGTRLLYSFKASDRGDDFHLWEYDLAGKKARQLTFGKGVADYEGCYLPHDELVCNQRVESENRYYNRTENGSDICSDNKNRIKDSSRGS